MGSALCGRWICGGGASRLLIWGLVEVVSGLFCREGGGGGSCTFWVVLQDLQVHVCVCNDDVELFVVRQEFCGDAFELVLAAPEEHHLVWFFLVVLLVF